MNYGKILSSAWKIFWKHKALFWFYLLTMLFPLFFGMAMASLGFFFNNEKTSNFFDRLPNNFRPTWVILFLLFYFGLMGIMFLLSNLMEIGTIKGALQAQKTFELLTVQGIWKVSVPYFWRALLVNVLAAILAFLIFALPAFLGAMIGALTAGIGFLCITPFILILLPLMLVWYLWRNLSITAVLADHLPVLDAMKHAYEIMKGKFWSLILMAVIIYLIQMAAGMAISIPVNIAQFGLMTSSGFMYETDRFIKTMGGLMMIFIPLAFIVQGISITYVNAAWALTYLEARATPASTKTEEDEIIVEHDA